jgi:hypothetical protein
MYSLYLGFGCHAWICNFFLLRWIMKSIIVVFERRSPNLFIVNNIKYLGNNSGGYDWRCI